MALPVFSLALFLVSLTSCQGSSRQQNYVADDVNSLRTVLESLLLRRVARQAQGSCNNGRPIILNNTNGTFTSPGWDGLTPHAANIVCKWRIQAPRRQKVNLTFAPFSVEAGPNCTYDSVAVFDGAGRNARLIGRYCNNFRPGTIISTGRNLFVVFTTDPSYQKAGFQARYSAISRTAQTATTTTPSEASPTPSPTPSEASPTPSPTPSEASPTPSPTPSEASPTPSEASPTPPAEVCRGIQMLTAPVGEITSPQYSGSSGRYPINTQCYWRITLPPGRRIRLSPVAFALEPSDGCVYDYVQVYDGESPDAMSLGRFCGRTVPATTESSSNDLLIKFKSDASVTASGFKFNYATIQGTVGPAVCGGTLTETSGTLSSPNFGAGRVYPNDAVCTWKIAAPDGNILKMTFETFSIEKSSNCMYDSVVIYDGLDKTGQQIGTYCGKSIPDPIESTGRYLFVEFTSDGSVRKAGFKANYAAQEKDEASKDHPGCGASRPATLNEAEGHISSPSDGPQGHYPDRAFCQWRIMVPQGKRAHVHFTAFNLEASSSCAYDVLDVFDGADDSARTLGRFCGNDAPSDITATANSMLIQFTSDTSITKPGFNISYSAKDASGGNGNENGNGGTDEPACGIPDQLPKFARIVGGQEAAPHSWPWQLSLQRRGGHICGGSVISRRWAITAAHCVFNNGATAPASDYAVHLGEHDMKRAEGTEQTIRVSEIVVHEQYNEARTENDIALLRLARDIPYSAAIKPVCLPRMDAPTDLMCVTTGWGNTQGTGDRSVLNQARVPIIGRETCKQPDYYYSRFTDAMICAGYPEGGKDSCQGDSGGPLVCRENGIYRLQGITSWGFGCARPKKPGIYTRVARFVSWVDQKTAGKFQSPP